MNFLKFHERRNVIYYILLPEHLVPHENQIIESLGFTKDTFLNEIDLSGMFWNEVRYLISIFFFERAVFSFFKRGFKEHLLYEIIQRISFIQNSHSLRV